MQHQPGIVSRIFLSIPTTKNDLLRPCVSSKNYVRNNRLKMKNCEFFLKQCTVSAVLCNIAAALPPVRRCWLGARPGLARPASCQRLIPCVPMPGLARPGRYGPEASQRSADSAPCDPAPPRPRLCRRRNACVRSTLRQLMAGHAARGSRHAAVTPRAEAPEAPEAQEAHARRASRPRRPI